MRKAKRIEIIYADPDYWYCALIGCVFSVTRETNEAYYVVVGGVSDNYSIGKSHVKVVEWDEPSYRERQAEWIKENDIKVGGKVWFAYSFEGYQDGFNYDNGTGYSSHVHDDAYTIKAIASDYIELEGIDYPVPYFSLEPVIDKHQPWETFEDKISLIGKLVRLKIDHSEVYSITGANYRGLRICEQFCDKEKIARVYEFLDGSPIGVNKVKELLE